MAFKDELANKPFTGWTQGYKMNNPTVLDLDAVKKTYEDLENWANNVSGSCTPGRIVSVIGDDTGKNGVYVVGSTKRETGEAAVIIKMSNLDKENITEFSLLKYVSSLPISPAAGDENKIHLVPASSTGTANIFEEYVWVPIGFSSSGSTAKWEKLGTIEISTEVDLSGYYTKTEVNSNFYTKSDVYTKTEVDNLINTISGEVDNLETKYNILGSSVEDLESDLDDLGGRLTTVEGQVSDLSGLSFITSYNSTSSTLTLTLGTA